MKRDRRRERRGKNKKQGKPEKLTLENLEKPELTNTAHGERSKGAAFSQAKKPTQNKRLNGRRCGFAFYIALAGEGGGSRHQSARPKPSSSGFGTRVGGQQYLREAVVFPAGRDQGRLKFIFEKTGNRHFKGGR